MLNLKQLFIVILIFHLLLPSIAHAQAISGSNDPKDILKAKIGIKIEKNDELRKAKAIDKISVGDKLSIYVKSWKNSYVYIINLNKTDAVLLNYKRDDQVVKKGIGRIFLGQGAGYSPDGLESTDALVVVVSPNENKKIIELFSSGPVPSNKWHINEEIIMQESSMVPPSELQEHMGFGGSLAGHVPSNKWLLNEKITPQESSMVPPSESQEHIKIGDSFRGKDPFWGKLRVSAGKSMIVRKYEFNIKK